MSGIIAVGPEGGKLAHMVATSPEFQAGDWIVDRTAAVSQASIWLQ